MSEHASSPCNTLPGELLAKLLPEIDNDTVIAIILHGSYARHNALPPYSDIDLVRITRETPEQEQQKQFLWYDGYLLNLSSRPLSIYKKWLTIPQEAIYRISTIRDARILLEKDPTFRAFQQEVLHNWMWEPLQPAADAHAGQLLAELSEVILRTLGALRYHNMMMLVERVLLHILPTVTEAVGVQKGILAKGNTYLLQIQEMVGQDSDWTWHYMEAAGVPYKGKNSFESLEERGRAALRLYQDTVHLLQPHLSSRHMKTIQPLLDMIDQGMSEEIT